VKRVVIFLFLLFAVLALLGCGQVKDDDIERPWTSPEPWEHTIGIGPFTPR
jgi:hypothetical protein